MSLDACRRIREEEQVDTRLVVLSLFLVFVLKFESFSWNACLL